MKKKVLTVLMAVLLVSGVIPANADASTGAWKHNSKGWWYEYSDGSHVQGTWLKSGGKWYHFDSDGYMNTGWQKIDGKWYFFNTSGSMHTGWKKINGAWYYFDGSGVMHTGWKKIVYYFDYGDGTIGSYSNWYYFKGSGVMQTGWAKIKGEWYYFDHEDGRMVTGMQEIDGSMYIFDENGSMMTGIIESETSAGKKARMYFDESGAWDGKINDIAVEYKDLTDTYTIVNKEIKGVAWDQKGIKISDEMKERFVPGSVIDITFTSYTGKLWLVFPNTVDEHWSWKRVGVGLIDGSGCGYAAYEGNHCQISYEMIALYCGDDVSKWGDVLQFESDSDWIVSSAVIGMAE